MRIYSIFLFFINILKKNLIDLLWAFSPSFFHQNKKRPNKSKLHQLLLTFLITLLFCLNNHFAKANNTMQLPLYTRGAKIIDSRGNQVLLRGVNWFGMETETHTPHGLWKRDYQQMLMQIKSLGYNMIRLPYSVQGLRSSEISGVDFSIGKNRELEGKTPIEVMDVIVEEAQRQDLMILLDSHRLNDERIPELWYGDGYTEADWINTWLLLAERYKNQPNVIGADLKNEPHGKASWGTDDLATDWRLAAERAGNAISKINPDWLIVVEGVEKNVPGQFLKHHWQGGNLEGVLRYPVRLSRRNKLVYSPHEYGPGVYDQPYFSDSDFPQNLLPRWQIGFNYISSQNRAPIFVGEFGGRLIDNREAIWMDKFVNYLDQKNLSFAYWSWNPNSEDTGGILKDDWKSINQTKQQLVSQLLPVQFIAKTPTKVPATEKPQIPTSNIAATVSTKPGLTVNTNIYTDWQTGFCTSFRITNNSSETVDNWQLKFNMNQAKINNSWNANFKSNKNQYTVNPLNWGQIIRPNQVREIGFCADKLGSDYSPQQVRLQVIKQQEKHNKIKSSPSSGKD